MLPPGAAEELDGVFYQDSKTRLSDIKSGTSQTILVGERSSELFDSTWVGVIAGSERGGWRVLGWTGEPPNNPPTSEVHFHGYAQFNSMHSGITNFVFADGSVHGIEDAVDPACFFQLGSIRVSSGN